MPKINTKTVFFSIILLICLTVILLKIQGVSVIRWFQYGRQEFPDGALLDATNYTINPDSILHLLDNGSDNIFVEEVEDSVSTRLPSNSILWKQSEYTKVAAALHEFEWNESLVGWKPYWMRFSIDRCKNVTEGIDRAEFLYYEHQKDLYVLHGVWINPLLNEVTTGYNQYPYIEEWSTLDVNKFSIKTVDEALALAEESGGRNAREKIGENNCSIEIFLNPRTYAGGFFSNPFAPYEWGWEVTYWQFNSGNLFKVLINPYTGKYFTAQ